jgi:hypothetical protein
MTNRFIVQKDIGAFTKLKWIIIDTGDTKWICGRFETKKNASLYSRRLNEKWHKFRRY